MGTQETADHRLLVLYRRYLGEPERTIDVFVGFALFFGGIAIGVSSLLVFLSSVAIVTEGSLHWQLREIAIALGMFGSPAFLLSIVILLPVSRRAVYASLVGVVLCLVAIGIFVTTYPQAWNVPGTDYSPQGIIVYSGGLAVLVASTGAALVAHHLELSRPRDVNTKADGTAESRTVTDEEVQQDIEETVAASDLTWGGVEASEPQRLQLSHDTDDELDASTINVAPNARTDDAVDSSVEALRQLRGWQPTTARGTGVDDQATALKELRKQSTEDDAESGWIRGVVDRLRNR